MKIGYARISTSEQKINLQVDELKKAGCEKLYQDIASGMKSKRPGFDECLNQLRKNDCLIVWRLDRLGRNLKDLVLIIEQLQKNNISFISLHEGFDTTTIGGKLIFQIFGALSEFERNLLQERTNKGLKAARARGRFGGRPKKLKDKDVNRLKKMYNSRDYSIKELCGIFGVSKPTLYKYIKE